MSISGFDKTVSQQPIIEKMKVLGYASNMDGVCAGIEKMWVEARIIGQEEEYFNRIAFICDPNIDHEVGIQIAKKKEKEREHLTDVDKKFLEIDAFFQGIERYFAPGKYELTQQYTQESVKEISQFTASESLENEGGIKQLYTESGIYSKDQINQYLEELGNKLDILYREERKKAEKKYPGGLPEGFKFSTEKIAISLGSFRHTMGLRYNASAHPPSWTLIDPNALPLSATSNGYVPRDMASRICNGFGGNDATPLNVSVFMASNNPYCNKLEATLNQFKRGHDQTHNEEINNPNNHQSLVELAIRDNDLDLMRKLFQKVDFTQRIIRRNEFPIEIAVRRGSPEMVKLMIENGVDPNVKNSRGETALQSAVVLNRIEIAGLLLEQANINIEQIYQQKTKDNTYLDFHVEQQKIEMLEFLLKKGVKIEKINPSVISKAVLEGQAEITKLLLNNGLKLEQLVPSHDGSSLLKSAIIKNQVEMARLFIDRGVNLDQVNQSIKEGSTIFEKSISLGRVNMVRLLLDKGLSLEQINKKDKRGFIPITSVMKNGNVGMAELLLSKGAELRKMDGNGQTALSIACNGRDPKMLHALILFTVKSGDVEALRQLLANKHVNLSEIRLQLVFLAIEHNQSIIIELLKTEFQIDPKTLNAELIETAAKKGKINLFKQFFENDPLKMHEASKQLIQKAARMNDQVIMYTLGKSGIDIKQVGRELIREAAQSGHISEIKDLSHLLRNKLDMQELARDLFTEFASKGNQNAVASLANGLSGKVILYELARELTTQAQNNNQENVAKTLATGFSAASVEKPFMEKMIQEMNNRKFPLEEKTSIDVPLAATPNLPNAKIITRRADFYLESEVSSKEIEKYHNKSITWNPSPTLVSLGLSKSKVVDEAKPTIYETSTSRNKRQ